MSLVEMKVYPDFHDSPEVVVPAMIDVSQIKFATAHKGNQSFPKYQNKPATLIRFAGDSNYVILAIDYVEFKSFMAKRYLERIIREDMNGVD